MSENAPMFSEDEAGKIPQAQQGYFWYGDHRVPVDQIKSVYQLGAGSEVLYPELFDQNNNQGE